ncbi:MAG: transposase [Verrucomicrobia bacterium]|nr:transposase [Verrucomicrobiota bacterium]
MVCRPTDQKTLYIQPGSPWEQAYIERFYDKLRDECLNRELFPSLSEARIILEQWRIEYNQHRKHSALGYLTPNQFSAQQTPTGCDRANERRKNGTSWTSNKARLSRATYLQSPV